MFKIKGVILSYSPAFALLTFKDQATDVIYRSTYSDEVGIFLENLRKHNQLIALTDAVFDLTYSDDGGTVNTNFKVQTLKSEEPLKLINPIPVFETLAEKILWIQSTWFNVRELSGFKREVKYAKGFSFENHTLVETDDEMDSTDWDVYKNNQKIGTISTYRRTVYKSISDEAFSEFFGDFILAVVISITGDKRESKKMIKEQEPIIQEEIVEEGLWNYLQRKSPLLRKIFS